MKGYIFGFIVLAGSIWLMLSFSSSAPGESFAGRLAPLSSDEEESAGHISATCEALVQDIGPRGANSLTEIESFLQRELRHMRMDMTEIPLDSAGQAGKAYEVMLPGGSLGRETIVLGAHLDSPANSPGADDNASGCAVLMEVLRLLANGGCDRTIRVVFWTGGAAPLAGTDKSTAWAYALRLRARHEKVAAVLCFDALGVYADAAGTESVPFPFSFSFPDRGDFVAFVGDWGTRGVMEHAVEQFRSVAHFPSEAMSIPSAFDFVSLSDDGAFRELGYPALRVTDTAGWRNPAIGTGSDVLPLLDYDRMARIARGMTGTVINLAKRTTPLM